METKQTITVRKAAPFVLGGHKVDEVLVQRGETVLLRGYFNRQRGLYFADGGAGMSRARFVAAMQTRFGG